MAGALFASIALNVARDITAQPQPDAEVEEYLLMHVLPVVYISIPIALALLFERGSFLIMISSFWAYWLTLPLYVGSFTAYAITRLTDISWGNRPNAGHAAAAPAAAANGGGGGGGEARAGEAAEVERRAAAAASERAVQRSLRRKGAAFVLLHLCANLALAFGFNGQLERGNRRWALLAMLTWVVFPVQRRATHRELPTPCTCTRCTADLVRAVCGTGAPPDGSRLLVLQGGRVEAWTLPTHRPRSRTRAPQV